jgi:hypothetical protein
MESSCTCCNEPSGSTKCTETIEWPRDWWPLEQLSALQLNHLVWIIQSVAFLHILPQVCFIVFLLCILIVSLLTLLKNFKCDSSKN